MDLYVTKAYVIEQLMKMWYEPKEICPSGILATVGKIYLVATMPTPPRESFSILID